MCLLTAFVRDSNDSLSKHERKVSTIVMSFLAESYPIAKAYSLLGNGGRESEGHVLLFSNDETEIKYDTMKLETLPTCIDDDDDGDSSSPRTSEISSCRRSPSDEGALDETCLKAIRSFRIFHYFIYTIYSNRETNSS